MKSEAPDLFRISPLCDMQNVIKMQMQQVLPERDENGSVIYLFRIRKYCRNKTDLFISICLIK